MLHHIIFIIACAQNVLLQYERKRWTLTRLANSMFNNARPRVARFCGFNDFLNRRMHTPVWIHCCKWPNFNLWISQGSAATVL